jgi:hypothetical protein
MKHLDGFSGDFGGDFGVILDMVLAAVIFAFEQGRASLKWTCGWFFEICAKVDQNAILVRRALG